MVKGKAKERAVWRRQSVSQRSDRLVGTAEASGELAEWCRL